MDIRKNASWSRRWLGIAVAAFCALALCAGFVPSTAQAATLAPGAVELQGDQDGFAPAATVAAAQPAKKTSLAKAKVTLAKNTYTYDGKAKKPALTVKLGGKKLVRGTDFTVSYKNNVKAGKATVTIKGAGAYGDKATKKFTIAKKSLSKAKVTLSKSSYAYDGKVKKPSATVKLSGKKLKKGTDFKIVYKNNKAVGTATATIKGIGNYKGSVNKKFKITPKASANKKDPIVRTWKGIALTAAGPDKLRPIGASVSTFKANLNGTCKLTLSGKSWSGKWAYSQTKQKIRIYAVLFTGYQRYVAGISKDGNLILTSYDDSNYSIVFN